MHKNFKNLLSCIFSCSFIYLSLSCCSMDAFASDGANEKSVSKGVIVFVMIAVFIVTAIASGYISYKLKTKNIRESKEDSSDND
ncbi:hypothetical protein [uncultured Ruminococcus sp.]|uniref:hypothetical protein n=1 Tax=uncultured Ruminococcus sp. TaxID=165186 RepID=UPI0025E6EF08|nr:hypothetical protein [uncultured Ruminococcus sp.]